MADAKRARSGLLDRHLAFVEALREARLPVSLAENLDAIQALSRLPLTDRDTLRAGYAATLVKSERHRVNFDALFDLYFPALVGVGTAVVAEGAVVGDPADGPEQLADFTERLGEAFAAGLAEPDPDQRDADPEAELVRLAREAVGRFGRLRGRAPEQSGFSAYSTLHRVEPQRVIDRLLAALLETEPDSDPRLESRSESLLRARLERIGSRFAGLVEAEARRRVAEAQGIDGADEQAKHATRPAITDLDFLHARRSDLAEMRRAITPLARHLATRAHRERLGRRRGRLDFRRTVRASLATGGVPMELKLLPRRPSRPELVVLCDVSGSVANFAQFTLLLVFALREHFTRLRAFTFVDDVHEVTGTLDPAGDPVEVMDLLAESARQATIWGRTNYGQAFARFAEKYADALTPSSTLLILGDARSNHSELRLDALREMVRASRHAVWLNPEHRRHWDTGDSAATAYGRLVPMNECRNLAQLARFIRDFRHVTE